MVDDDPEIRRELGNLLAGQGWSVDSVSCAEDCLRFLEKSKFDLILLDWKLPDRSGLEICTQFRQSGGTTPIIFVTGDESIDNKESGLDAGGDDYITKPFEARELLARIRAIQRRPRTMQRAALEAHNISLDPYLRVVKGPAKSTYLSVIENAILEYLLRNRNCMFTAAQLYAALWPAEEQTSDETVRVHMRVLRRKLSYVGAEQLIETVRNGGYVIKEQSGR